jgi:hypothetical protein
LQSRYTGAFWIAGRRVGYAEQIPGVRHQHPRSRIEVQGRGTPLEVSVITSAGKVASQCQRAACLQRPRLTHIRVPPAIVDIYGHQAGGPKLTIGRRRVFGNELDLCALGTLRRPEESCAYLTEHDGWGARIG